MREIKLENISNLLNQVGRIKTSMTILPNIQVKHKKEVIF